MIIDGLTARQVEICDMLWECETRHELDELLYALGPEARDAKVLMEIMIQEEYERDLRGMQSFPDAEAIIEKMKK